MTTGWVIGFAVGGVVVVIVATLAIILILEARKISNQAEEIHAALEAARDNTAGLWEVDSVNRSLRVVRDSAVSARMALTRGGP